MRVLFCLFGSLAGLVLGWFMTAAGALVVGELAGVSQFEGAFAMGAVFQLGPLGGLFGAVLGGWLGWRRAGRKRRI
ncbi:hypothetical protein [Bosea sp. BH3]|uniref:hypothetical protein n=1 Tax=Bosea sp. BH3 TaxID=2871701 RepID=UPI0021CB4C37|nr:hypothetical protein [Bosea sp. BH3]MCU4180644.1 hypothetical protein [Bosea sp. BH3]